MGVILGIVLGVVLGNEIGGLVPEPVVGEELG